MNIIATPKSKFEKAVKKCAVSPLNKKNLNFVFIFKYLDVRKSHAEFSKVSEQWKWMINENCFM